MENIILHTHAQTSERERDRSCFNMHSQVHKFVVEELDCPAPSPDPNSVQPFLDELECLSNALLCLEAAVAGY